MKVYKQRNPRKSKFEPYRETISTLFDSGLKIREVADALDSYMDDVVDINALYCYARSRGLLSNCKPCAVPKCAGCDGCIQIINTHDKPVLLCMSAKRIVSRSCRTSPEWCEKRKKAERVS